MWQKIITSRSKIFLFCLLFFLLGVAVAEIAVVDAFVWFCFFLALTATLIIFWSRPNIKPLIFWGLFFVLGLWRLAVVSPDLTDPSRIYFYTGGTQRFYGTIDSVDTRLNKQKIVVSADTLITGRSQRPVSGQVLINTGLSPKFQAGQRLALTCLLSRPQKIDDFDYEKYLARYGIYAICSFAQVSSIDPLAPKEWTGKIFQLFRSGKIFLLGIKDHLSVALALTIAEPEASFFQGFILNERGNISQDWLDKFSIVGLTHIIAISGSHIAVMVIIIETLLIYLGLSRPRAFWPVAIIVSAYTLMIGAPASAVRSVIMALTMLYARKIGRLGNSANAVVLAAALMNLANPRILLSDAGFQLSFVSVLGLIYLQPILRQKLSRWRLFGWFGLQEILSATVAAQIMTLPLIIFYFNRLSLVALFANILVLPLAPLMLVWGIINAILGAFFLPLGHILGYVSWFLGGYFLLVTDWLSQWSLAAVTLPASWASAALLLYLPLGWWLWKRRWI